MLAAVRMERAGNRPYLEEEQQTPSILRDAFKGQKHGSRISREQAAVFCRSLRMRGLLS